MDQTLVIRRIDEADRAEWVRMRDALWPGARASHEDESRAYFDRGLETPVVFVAERVGGLVGFLELDYRNYAPGCESSPVPFIEGWYVDPHARGEGIGRALVAAAESLARSAGHKEIGSDVEIDNAVSIAVHLALGYEETDRVVSFRRSLDDKS